LVADLLSFSNPSWDVAMPTNFRVKTTNSFSCVALAIQNGGLEYRHSDVKKGSSSMIWLHCV